VFVITKHIHSDPVVTTVAISPFDASPPEAIMSLLAEVKREIAYAAATDDGTNPVMTEAFLMDMDFMEGVQSPEGLYGTVLGLYEDGFIRLPLACVAGATGACLILTRLPLR
jgi:hypothetical protein